MSRTRSGRKGVAYVFMTFPAPSETFAAVELQALRRRRVDIVVYTLRPPPVAWEQVMKQRGLDGITVVHGDWRTYAVGVLKCLLAPRVTLSIFKDLIAGVRLEPQQTVKGIWLLPIAIAQAARIAQSGLSNAHLFWGHYPSLVGIALRSMAAPVKVTMFLGAYDLVSRLSISRYLARNVPVTTHAVVNCTAISEFVGIPRNDILVIYRGIRVRDICFDLAVKKRRVVIAERLTVGKKTKDALMVFAGALQDEHPAELVVLGDGPEMASSAALADELGLSARVKFRGHVPHREVLAELSEAQVFLSMSQKPGERLPNAVKEAMAAGCVVVVGKSPGIEELVEDGVNGFVVPEGDTALAIDRVFQLFSDKGLMERMAVSARASVVNRFDVDKLTDKRLEFFGLDV